MNTHTIPQEQQEFYDRFPGENWDILQRWKAENENLKQTFEYLKKVVEDGKEFKIDEGDEGQIVIDTKCPKCGEFWNFNECDECCYCD
jgi:hypothetical protein